MPNEKEISLKSRHKWPELLREMMDGLIFTYVKHGNTKEQAEANAQISVDVMISIMGGQSVYFPKGIVLKAARRSDRILEEFTGFNHAELARRHDVSEQYIYRIIQKQREHNRNSECAKKGDS